VLTEDGLEHVGLVYTVDPVSESFILTNFDDGKLRVDIILGHTVSSVSVLNEDTDTYKQQLDRLFRPQEVNSMTEEEVKQRQTAVRLWLLKNRLPAEVTGSQGENLTIAEALVIQPPYGADNCVSDNEIILGKIQGLIQNMPADQQDW